jgi:transglutaminase-like putative cysteine protease
MFAGGSAGRSEAPERDGRARLAGPAEGWLSVLALLSMLLLLGWAVDAAEWAGRTPGTGASETAFLPLTLVLGAAWGLLGAKLRWHPLVVHAVGAVLGAALAIYLVAGTVPVVHGFALPARDPFHLANLLASIELFLRDVLVRQVRSDQTSAFLLLVAAVGWASGEFAAFTVYRHHRSISAVLFLGLLLLASMSLTLQDQYGYLVAYAAASLLLLVRTSLAEQRGFWSQARLADQEGADSLYVRNGVAFSAVALAGAVLLTATASAAPLRSYWTGSADQVAAWATGFDRLASGVVAPIRGPATLFGDSQTIQGLWQSSPALAYQVRTSTGQGYYWQGASYDDFDGHTWKQSDQATSGVIAPGRPVLADSVDQVVPGKGTRAVTVTVTPVDTADPTVLSPQTPYAVSLPVQVQTAAAGGPMDEIQLAVSLPAGGTYQVRALVRNGAVDQVTANQLAAAGTVYPEWARRYIQIEPGSIGPIVTQDADRLVAKLPAGQRDPYHVAQAFQDWLYSGGGFIYDTDVRGLCAPGMPVPDCLLTSHRGYCEYFATTLVMMLRTQQIPARYVVGYLPGRPSGGVFEVDRAAAHAWVEVYFPRYGWVRFDPTPGNAINGQQPTNLPAGPPVPTPVPHPGASASPHPGPTFVPDTGGPGGNPRPRIPGSGQGGAGAATGGLQGALPGAALFVLILFSVALVTWARLRLLTSSNPSVAYSGVARLAARFGYAPRPAQTVYEYAAMLGDAVPSARPDLEVVARARVEAIYGRRTLGPARGAAIRRAYGRARVRLLRLALRYRRARR